MEKGGRREAYVSANGRKNLLAIVHGCDLPIRGAEGAELEMSDSCQEAAGI